MKQVTNNALDMFLETKYTGEIFIRLGYLSNDKMKTKNKLMKHNII